MKPSTSFALVLLLISSLAQAAGKAPPKEPSRGKRMIALDHVDQVEIQMPDGSFYPFGEGYCARMETTLVQSGKYNVHWPRDVVNCQRQQEEAGTQVLRSRASSRGDDIVWAGTSYPVANIRVKVKAMNFTTGWKGEQIFSGFDERNRSRYNDGFNRLPNEFPLKDNDASVASPNWLDHHFDAKGEAPYDSRSGLDIGDGFSLNFLFVWLAVKYARYSSDLALQIEIVSELLGRHEYRELRVGGEGFFFDVSGAYLGYSVGIQAARKDAMNQAFDAAITGSMGALDRALADFPLVGRIDYIFAPGVANAEARVAVGTGFKSEIPVGTVFYVREAAGVELEALLSNEYGTVMRVKRGDYRQLSENMIALQKVGEVVIGGVATQRLAQASAGPDLAATENIQLPWKNLKQLDFKNGDIPKINVVEAFFQSLVGLVTLPYRIWRYSMYDRPYQAQADSPAAPNQNNDGEWSPPMDPQRSAPRTVVRAPAAVGNLSAWIERLQGEAWATRIGWRGERAAELDQKRVPVIAIIDSGVDYNHPVLHGNLQLKPNAPTDPRGQRARYGWDFVSGDSRAADDHFHGTELASLAVAIAPNARYLPIKAFSPYGITSSAAIYSAFEFAVKEGADVILCGWATRKASQAIEDGVAYAKAHGVLVVAAAGDRGRSFANTYYPATLSKWYDNVLPVYGVDAQDRFAASPDFSSNFSPEVDGLAAPAAELPVANPRGEYAVASSTSHAAALVAGAVARKLAAVPAQDARPAPAELIAELLADADVVPALATKVKGGKRLRLR